MRVKLDENLGNRGLNLLKAQGHDVTTVAQQDLCAASDSTLAEICRIEERVLVTLDTDFANTIRFRPSRYAGLVVLRLPEPLRREDIDVGLGQLMKLAATRSVVGKLWIVDQQRIREFDEQDDVL